jgi:hypothetical protein
MPSRTRNRASGARSPFDEQPTRGRPGALVAQHRRGGMPPAAVAHMHEDERPHEPLRAHGPASLANTELLRWCCVSLISEFGVGVLDWQRIECLVGVSKRVAGSGRGVASAAQAI